MAWWEESGKSSLNPISKLLGQNDSKSALKIGRDDDEMDYTAWDADDLDMRQLLERLQLHHDSMEREFLDQKEEVSKLQDILQKEADELKSLLASNTLENQASRAGVKMPRGQALLTRCKAEMASRRMYEASEGAIEAKVMLLLNRLQELLGSSLADLGKFWRPSWGQKLRSVIAKCVVFGEHLCFLC